MTWAAAAVAAQSSRPSSASTLTPMAAEDAVYGYTDERGRLIYVQRLQDVPERLREHARRVDVPEPAAQTSALDTWLGRELAAPREPLPVMYRYRGASGAYVYTNLAESIPLPQRAAARIDLRDVPLNSELGAALDRQLAQRHAALSQASACVQLRAAEEGGAWERWLLAAERAGLSRDWLREHASLVVCGAAALLLLLCTPFMFRAGWGGAWARVLKTGLPMLGCAALSAVLLARWSRATEGLHAQSERCKPAAWQKAPGLTQRFQLVQALEAEQRTIDAASRAE